MLGLTKQAGLGACQDQGEASSQLGPRNRADWRLDEIRHRGITVIKEGLGPEFHFPRRRREAARVSVVVASCVLGVTRSQRFPYSGSFRSKLIQGDATRTELLPVSGIDITVPEMLAKAEKRSEVKDQ